MGRRKSHEESDAMPPAAERDEGAVVIGDGVLPSDAEKIEDVIDRRFKALLSMTTEAKDLTKALEAATKWYETKRRLEGEGEWGSQLKGGTVHER